MFHLNFTNIPDAGSRQFATLDEAIAAGKKAGFEWTVWHDGSLVASKYRRRDSRFGKFSAACVGSTSGTPT